MRYRKIAAILLMSIVSAISLAGCGDTTIIGNYDNEAVAKSISSKVVASNEKYELKWDDKAKCVLLVDKDTQEVWSDILYDAYLEGSTSANAQSALSITVVNSNNMTWETISSVAELQSGGKMVCEEIEDGVCVTYYFDRLQLAIPVTYQLRKDSVALSINGADIQEDGTTYKLVSVGVAPYFCSASDANEENYLFVPSGSGALMYTTENADGTRKYSSEVYGTDATRRILKSTEEQEEVRLPVFGAKDGDTAVLGIIEEGAGAAFIEAQAGYARLGYSQVGTIFYFRGYDIFRHGTYATGNSVITRTSEERSTQKVTVAYYPLQGEDADYNGMASCYRQYLIDNGELTNSDISSSAYSVTMLGGTTVSESFVGVPYQTLAALTEYTEAEEILAELTSTNGTVPVVRMQSYSDNGLLPGTIAGGKTYDSVYGSKKELKALQEYCEEANISLFWDSDVVRYSKSGSGVSYNSDCAETAIHYQATQYPVSPIRVFDEDNPYRIIGRDSLADAVNLALKKADKYEHEGISFSSLSSLAFSDYEDAAYITRAGIEKDVKSFLTQGKDQGKLIAVADANSYAACVSDVIFDVALDYGDYNVLDEEIPFYQLVFHSYKPMYSSAINLAENTKKQIMLSAASGTGLGFSVISEYAAESSELEFYELYGSLYEDNKALVQEALTHCGFLEYYEKTADSVMTKYELLGNGVSATYFENGVVLYANHTAETVESPVGELDAYMFKVQ